jgi:hypothetical protein
VDIFYGIFLEVFSSHAMSRLAARLTSYPVVTTWGTQIMQANLFSYMFLQMNHKRRRKAEGRATGEGLAGKMQSQGAKNE